MYYRLVHVGALHTKACIEVHVIRFLTRSVEIGNTEGVKSKLPTATDVTFWLHPRFSSCRLDGLALLCCLVNSKWLFMIILYCIGNTCGVLRLPTVIDRDKVVLVCIVYRPPKPRTRQNETRFGMLFRSQLAPSSSHSTSAHIGMDSHSAQHRLDANVDVPCALFTFTYQATRYVSVHFFSALNSIR